MRRNRRLPQDQQGSALVEFVISIPVVLIVLFGCVEIGRLILAYHDIDRQVRGAARYLARIPCESVTTLLPAAQNLAIYGSTINTTAPIYPYWDDPATITMTQTPAGCTGLPVTPTLTLTAAVDVPFPFLPFIGLPNTLTITAAHTERMISE